MNMPIMLIFSVRVFTIVFVCSKNRIDTSKTSKKESPALLVGHEKFDNFQNLIVTHKCEPTGTTRRRNHETDRQFKSRAPGV